MYKAIIMIWWDNRYCAETIWQCDKGYD